MAATKRTASARRKPCKANQVRSSVTHRCRLPVAVAKSKAKKRAKSYYRKHKASIAKKAKSVRRRKASSKRRRVAA